MNKNLSKIFYYLLKVAILSAAYFVTARIGLSFDAVSGFATLIWPPSGISLAFLLIFDYWMWPGIFIGAFFANYSVGAAPLVAFGIGVGNTLGPLFGAYMYKRFIGNEPVFARSRNILTLIFFGALLGPMISASMGTNSLLWGGTIKMAAYGLTWSAWWIGDMLGIIIVTPLILTWWKNWRIPNLDANKRAETWLVFISVILVSMMAFWDVLRDGLHDFPASISYLIFPPLVWAALRFSPRVTATAITLMSVIAVFGTVSGFGPFANEVLSHGLLYLQIYIAATAVTIMILSTVVSERRSAEEQLHKLNQELEQNVEKRTFELRRAQEIIDKSFEAIMIANGTQEHLIQYVNPAWEEMTGWKSEDVVGKESPRILKSGKTTPEFYKKLWETILAGNIFSAEITNKKKDGTFYEAEINIIPITSKDNIHYYAEVSRDITERKKMATQLSEYTKGLEGMVAERTKELEEKVNDLEKLNKFMVGRELRMIELKDKNKDLTISVLKNKAPQKSAKKLIKKSK